MLDLIYTLLIYPLEALFGVIYLFLYEITAINGLAIVGLSFAVNLLSLPMYTIAERWQQRERDLQKKFKPRLEILKSCFKGSERHMIIKTFYRQNNYHPLYSLRSLMGLAIQIPFFIAAWRFLSDLDLLQGSSFLGISDLGRPDGLLRFGDHAINLLPILMTLVNIISSVVYSKGQTLREKLQLHLTAVIFLVLLYQAPAGLALYWTLNNVFSLGKNIVNRCQNPWLVFKRILAGIVIILTGTVLTLTIRDHIKVERFFADRLEGKVLVEEYPGFMIFVDDLNKKAAYLKTDKDSRFETKGRRSGLPKNILYHNWEFSILDTTGLKPSDYLLGEQIDGSTSTTENLGKSWQDLIPPHLVFKTFSSIILTLLVLPFLLILVPRLIRGLDHFVTKNAQPIFEDARFRFRSFVLFSLSLSVLAGLIGPSFLVLSSPLEFSQAAGSSNDVIGLVLQSGLEALALFFILPLALYGLFGKRFKGYLSLVMVINAFAALANWLIFSGDYGVISPNFVFDDPSKLSPGFGDYLGWLLVLILSCGLGLLYAKKIWQKHILSIPGAILLSLVAIVALNLPAIVSSQDDYRQLTKNEKQPGTADSLDPIYHLSRTGKNVFIIILDRAIGSYVGEAIKLYPELNEDYAGFVWYPNTVSFHGHTIMGMPPIYGGYEYTPIAINQRKDETLKDKHNEALMVLPRLFNSHGYRTKLVDPPYVNHSSISDMSFFTNYPWLETDLIGKRYTSQWISEFVKPDFKFDEDEYQKTAQNNFFRFGIFRILPKTIRQAYYQGGVWGDIRSGRYKKTRDSFNHETLVLIDHFSKLFYTAGLTRFDEGGNRLTILMNAVIHESQTLYPPEYLPGLGSHSDLAKINYPVSEANALAHLTTEISSFKQIARWLKLLRDEGVYDNTKIIMVSDHGRDVENTVFKGFWDNKDVAYYHPILLVKDFGGSGNLRISSNFMTTADVPWLAASHLDQAKNPFSDRPLADPNDKAEGVTISKHGKWRFQEHGEFVFDFPGLLHIRENIFSPENWTEVKP